MHKINKKGIMIEVYSALMIMITAVVFFLLFNLPGCDGDVPEQKLSQGDLKALKDEYNLASFLRIPVEVEGQMMNMAELIILYDYDNDYLDILKNKSTEVLMQISPCSIVCIDTRPDLRIGKCANYASSCLVNQKIPTFDGNITVALDTDPIYIDPYDAGGVAAG